jgi:chitinase
MRFLVLFLIICHISLNGWSQTSKKERDMAVIGYYAGPPSLIDSFKIEQLTHLIFCFCHLKGNQLSISNARDSASIRQMVALKARNPQLKIILSLGGWGGCQTCSPVFASKKDRKAFARSVRDINDYFHTDGIDIDWEYPAIAGFPGHPFGPEDKPAFTALVKQLRKKLGHQNEISFAAGGFTKFIDSSIEWKKVMPRINRVNIMSYDLVHGFSSQSGHHTPLYSTPGQVESTDNAVRKLMAAGVPASKIVIGAAFYGRLFKVTDTLNNGLYQPASFDHGFSYRSLADTLGNNSGFLPYWDSLAKAPYAYNPERKLLATYDDSLSIRLKTKYVKKLRLNGIMFWQLADDRFENGLLNVIDKTKKEEVE